MSSNSLLPLSSAFLESWSWLKGRFGIILSVADVRLSRAPLLNLPECENKIKFKLSQLCNSLKD